MEGTISFKLGWLRRSLRGVLLCCVVLPLCSCVGLGRPAPSPQAPTAGQGTGQPVDPRQAERLQRLMVPLVKVMDNPIASGKVQLSIVDDPAINAGSAGSGNFLVTSGLLQRASDQQLQAILAHEVAHDDLGHVSKAQTLGAGVNIAKVLLDQLVPASSIFTPVAGTLLIRAYGRREEYAADKHGVELLRRIKAPDGKAMMVDALTWLRQTAGSSGGGFFGTHPDTGDRIDTLREMP